MSEHPGSKNCPGYVFYFSHLIPALFVRSQACTPACTLELPGRPLNHTITELPTPSIESQSLAGGPMHPWVLKTSQEISLCGQD